MAAPSVAVIGAGAWGTTLARLVARVEPVTLLCHSPETAARIRETGRNEARLPGVDLPSTVIATADPEALAAATDLVVFAAPVRAPAGDDRVVRPVPRRDRRTSCRSSRASSATRCCG